MIDRQPLGVADWTRRSQIAAQHFRKLFRQCEIVFTLDAAANGDNDVRLAEVNRLLNFLKRRFRSHANVTHVNGFVLYLSAASLLRLIRPERSRLKSCEDRRGTVRHHIDRKSTRLNSS